MENLTLKVKLQERTNTSEKKEHRTDNHRFVKSGVSCVYVLKENLRSEDVDNSCDSLTFILRDSCHSVNLSIFSLQIFSVNSRSSSTRPARYSRSSRVIV